MRTIRTILLAISFILTGGVAASAQPGSTPGASHEANLHETMLTQSYIDFSEEALESDSMPNIVMISVMEFPDNESAERGVQSFDLEPNADPVFTVTELDDLGDEAIFIEQVDEGGDHGATTIARVDNILILVFVTGAPESPEISQEIAMFMVETGPSDDDLAIAEDGTATGGWADAFPEVNDIDALNHFESQPVTELPD